MESNRDIEKLITEFKIKPVSGMRSNVLDDALKMQDNKNQQKKSGTSSRPKTMLISSKVIKFAVAALIFLAINLLIFTNVSDEPKVENKYASQSPIDMMTEISLERAFRQGGIEAVYEQSGRAFPAQSYQSKNPSVNEIFKELETFENNF
jgi:hypothetical protein